MAKSIHTCIDVYSKQPAERTDMTPTDQAVPDKAQSDLLESLFDRLIAKRDVDTAPPFRAIEDQMDSLMEKMDQLVETLDNHIRNEEGMIEKTLQGFPDGDAYGHCRWHEDEIERIHNSKEFWRDLRKSLVQWGVIGLLGWFLSQFWDHFLVLIKKG